MTTRTAMQLLPYLAPSQAQKHVTYNSAIKLLDVLVQTSAGSRFLTAPPVGAVAGDSHIVGDGATGDWLGQDRNLAVFTGDFWDFYVPKTGWRVWVEAEGTEAVFDGTGWTTSADRPERVAVLGVSALADDTNRLTVSADASLFNNAGAGHQIKVNKAAAGNTASLLFQTGYSGRAEMGTVGSDAFTIKVSPDGTTFLTGLTIEPATGKVVAAHGVNIAPGAGDPASPQDGDIWYNSTTGKLRVRQAGASLDMLSVGSGLMDLSTAQTVTGAKTFSGTVAFTGAQTIIDSGLTLQDDLDTTKKANFQLSGLSTGTTRTYSLPNVSGALLADTQVTTNISNTTNNGVAVNIATAATVSGGTKTVSIGTGGVSGATSNVTIGSSTAGVAGTLTINSPTVTFGSTVSSVTVPDAAFTLADNADATKKAQFELSGLTTGTTRSLALPDASGTLALNTVFGASTNGLTPASGGGTANFLRADGTWALPPGGGGGSSYPTLTSIPPAIDAIDGLTPVADGLAYYTGASTAALTTLSSYGRSLIDDADAAAARTTLERQDFATRAAFVTWAAGKTPAAGLVMRAGGYRYRYIGSGTAIGDLPGWVPEGTPTALHWGADNTGATNALTAVSAMIDHVNAAGGGVALMPAGTYLWQGGLVKQGLNRVILEGEGNKTRIQRQGNQTLAAIRFWGGANNRIRRILIDCAGYAGRGFYLGDQYSGFEDCECNNCPDRPFGMQGGGNTIYGLDSLGRTSDDAGFTTATFFPVGCYVDNCRTNRSGNTAISQKMMPHSRITRCTVQNSYSEGITVDRCDHSVVMANTLINVSQIDTSQFPDLDAGTGFLSAGGGGVGGMGIDGPQGARVVKNTIIGVQTTTATRNNRNRAAINFVNNIQASSGCQVEGNYISDAKAGIWLKGTGSGAAGNNFRHLLTGNVFDTMGTGAGTGMAQYGAIWIDAGCTDNVVQGNTQVGGVPLITGATAANAVDQMAATSLKGNATAAQALGQDLTGTQVTAMLDVVGSATKGLAPASGGGTTNFLRADGTWAAATVNLNSGASGTLQAAQAPALSGDVTSSAGSLATAIAAGAVGNAKLASMAAATIKGNNAGTAGVPLDLTGTQVTAMLDVVGSATKGLAPASGGGTLNFLRADGTWAVPPGSGGGITDGDKGDVIVSGGGSVWSLDYASVNAVIAPVFANLSARPTTVAGYGITDAVALSGAQTIGGAKTFSAPVILTGQASDPVGPANGTIWYNATTNQLKAQSNGAAVVIDSEESLPWLTPAAGEYMLTTAGAGGAATTTLAGAAGRVDLFPFAARGDIAVTGVAINVTTLVASALAKVVVYDSDTLGRPNALITETADMDCGTAGVRTATASFTLRQGKTYWLGIRHSSTATLSAWASSATPDINGGTPVTTLRKVVRRTLAYATPATSTWGWSSAEINAALGTAIWLKA